MFNQVLQAEGDSGLLFVYAQFFGDSSFYDISYVESFSFSMQPAFITAGVEYSNGNYIVTVLEGADSVAGYWMDVSLLDSNGDAMKTGSPVATISLPPAIGVDTSNNCGSKITRPNDRAVDIFNQDSNCQISVTLLFPGILN